jgi:hypothetical protein
MESGIGVGGQCHVDSLAQATDTVVTGNGSVLNQERPQSGP